MSMNISQVKKLRKIVRNMRAAQAALVDLEILEGEELL